MRFTKKVCLLGDFSVGKTSLIRRFVYDAFTDKYITTVGTKISSKIVKISDEIEVNIMIWDIVGNLFYKTLQLSYFKGSNGGLLVYDITREDTLINLRNWVDRFQKVVGKVPLIFIANKIDLKDQVKFGLKESEDVLREFNSPFFVSSAKTGENVEKIFNTLGKNMVR